MTDTVRTSEEWFVLNLCLQNSTNSREQLSQHWDPQEATTSHASKFGQQSLTLELPNSRECTATREAKRPIISGHCEGSSALDTDRSLTAASYCRSERSVWF